MKKRATIPNRIKIRSRLQKEIDSSCPFCSDSEVEFFEIHHIDKDSSNNDISNLLLTCRNCHTKIHDGAISAEEVQEVKSLIIVRSKVEFVSVKADSEQCGWIPLGDIPNAFLLARTSKSPYLILNFVFINNSEKPMLMTAIELSAKSLPTGLTGPAPRNIFLKPSAFFELRMSENQTERLTLNDELILYPKTPIKIQILLFTLYEDEKFPPRGKFVLDFNFLFNKNEIIKVPKILLNCRSEDEKLRHFGLS